MPFNTAEGRRELEEMGREIVSLLVRQYQETLTRNRKVATRKTVESVTGEADVTTNEVNIKITANQSLFFIISGRRRGAKLPVRRVGDRFELFPDLQEWKVAVGFRGNDYVLARAISEKGIEGVPITNMVLDAVGDDVRRIVSTTLARVLGAAAANEIRESFRQIRV